MSASAPSSPQAHSKQLRARGMSPEDDKRRKRSNENRTIRSLKWKWPITGRGMTWIPFVLRAHAEWRDGARLQCMVLTWSYVPCRGTIINVLRLLFDLSVKLATNFGSAIHSSPCKKRPSKKICVVVCVYLERNSIKQIFGLADSGFDRTGSGRACDQI